MGMKRITCFFVIAMLLQTYGNPLGVDQFDGKMQSYGDGYISGPLPYLHLKNVGFDVEHALRQMESPSPEPSPKSKCPEEKNSVKEACQDLENKRKKADEAESAYIAAILEKPQNQEKIDKKGEELGKAAMEEGEAVDKELKAREALVKCVLKK